ncbi:Glycosyl transferase 4-like domain-containing protein [Klenkia soli]|uniref:Glycosyl transferase 4-like domain-containing protein n=1 Tax=Klenkia soli TaxID=1052260 RepID=A0A1H0CGD3_9ACTN|nr:glycosyltransferase [Klenkia soli]SDN56974.1 Glycosyl transferase 4-like domain-containing protein [Klenkia soli]
MDVLICKTKYSGLSYHRVEEPARAVNEAGVGVRVTVAQGLSTTMSRGADSVVLDVDDQGADVVVLQLPKTVELLQCMRILQARGVAVVVEIDDLLSGVPFGHQGHGIVRSGLAQRAADCAREADMVTVTTPALRDEYARHGRGAVVPNAIPRRLAELPPAYERTSDVVEIGWTGNVLGHPYDLQVMGSGLEQALSATAGSSRFTVLGQKFDMQQRLGLTTDPREVLWLPEVDAYIQAIGELFDVGVAPLRIDKFNTAKSWLKVLEYSARGVYSVRSASAEYERLGLGWRAKAPKDWAKALTKAVRDDEWRREQARAAHQVVLDQHLTEHSVPLWLGAWQRAAENRATALRRGAVAVG